MLPVRITSTVSWNIHLTLYISKYVNDVVMTKTVTSFPNQKDWMNGVPNALLSGQVTRKHTTLPRARLKAGDRGEETRAET